MPSYLLQHMHSTLKHTQTLWLLFLLFGFLTLSACSQTRVEEHFTNLPGTSDVGENQAFTNQTNAALLIVGIRANSPLQSAAVTANWQQYDPNTQTLVDGGASIEVSFTSGDQNALNLSETKYYVLSIRPGFYILERASTTFRPTGFSVLDSAELLFPSSVINIKNERYGHSFYERLYVPFGRGRVELDQSELIQDLISSSISHQFFVNPGDMVYIGNFVVGRNAPWVLKVDRDIPAVKTLLKENYPNVKGRLLFRHSFKPTNVTCDFKNDREQGLQALRAFVIQNNMTADKLATIGCTSGTKAMEKDEIIAVEDDNAIEFGLPKLGE